MPLPNPRRGVPLPTLAEHDAEFVGGLPEPVRQLLDDTDPATGAIISVLPRVASTGMDITNPAVLDEAIRAGRAEFAERPPTPAELPTPAWHRPAHKPVVYFMRIGNRVKIGYTTNLDSRTAAIRPEEVMATEPGGAEREAELHERFAAHRTVGEWFKLDSDLPAYIEQLQGVTRARTEPRRPRADGPHGARPVDPTLSPHDPGAVHTS